MTEDEQFEYRYVVKPDEMTARAGESASRQASELFRRDPVRGVLGRLLRVPTEDANWRKGAKGEIAVGRLLDKLPKDRWKVFHDLPLGPSGVNVDHLIVGSSGVYSINTKNLRGKVWLADRALLVNGQKTKYLRASFMEAKEVSRRLTHAVGEPVSVTPMLVLICDELTRKSEPTDVVVLRRGGLLRWLKQRPTQSDLAAASRIAKAAGRAATWT